MTGNGEHRFEPSPWPLPAGASRVLISPDQVRWMADDGRTRSLHPHGFGFYPQASGHGMARREHADGLVIYCVEGQGHCELGDMRHPVAAGDLLVLPPGQPHRYRAARQQPWSIFWMHLGGDALAHWLAPFASLPGQASVRSSPVTRIGQHEQLVHDFRLLLESTSSGYREENLLLAASLCQQLLATATVLANRQQDSDEARIQKLHAYMDTHLDARLTLAELQAVYGVGSRFTFIRTYKQRTGQTPVQAFMHRKMSHACYLLETSDVTVIAIASQLGFDDPYYFSRAFTRVVGQSPARYRARGQR